MKLRIGLGITAVAVVVAIVLVVRHLAGPSAAARAVRLPSVAVVPVARRDLYEELTVQAEFRPYEEVELYAKVAGYLKTIDVDFGDRVKRGEAIATIEVPELRDQLAGAVAAEQRAEAQYHDAHLDYIRLVKVNEGQPELVAAQDLDTAEAKDRTSAAAVAAARADVSRYRTLVDYTQITAPFDGVVTRRYADPGAMIQTASSSQTQALPLIRLSENQRLRLDFPVSVSYAEDIAKGEPVEILLDGFPRPLHAVITRFTRQIDMSTRTMDTEVEVPNPDLRLIPGMYATVRIRLDEHPGALAVPVEAVNTSGPTTVYLLDSGDRIQEQPVRLGLETSSFYQVLSGLQAGDRVVIGNRASLAPGERVQPKLASILATP